LIARIFLSLIICGVICGVSLGAPANAPDPDSVEARKHYQRGMAHFRLREYPQAIEEFQDAYRIHPDPVILFDLGQTHRLAGAPSQALHFYRAYLSAAPEAENRAEVEARIAELEKTPSAPVPTPAPLVIAASPAPGKQLEPPITVEKSAVVGKRTPAYKRWWVWTLVGVVVAGAAVGTAVGVTQSGAAERKLPGLSFP
jgi:tetratricopeptide (TPR) repeat protein